MVFTTPEDPKTAFLLVNFGGPRDLEEIRPFLIELLTDQDVIQTKLPSFVHKILFRKIASKRSLAIKADYELIGGKSPIYSDTEQLAMQLGNELKVPILTFHRYLPKTHVSSLKKIEEVKANEIRVLPLFPQFTFATSGSIARFFSKRLSKKAEKKLRWIPSYPDHPLFISSFQNKIGDFIRENNLREEKILFLFSAHGVPKSFKDGYREECEKSYHAIIKAFPNAASILCYQSQFGKEEWIRPYTKEVCEEILQFNQGRQNVVFIPLSFPSDHIETLFEIEHQYLPLVKQKGLEAYRCPALNLEPYWIDAIKALFLEEKSFSKQNKELIRSS